MCVLVCWDEASGDPIKGQTCIRIEFGEEGGEKRAAERN